jgi:hypothetical protein
MLTSSRASFKIASSCPEFSGITYASALKGSKTTPCTNVPVICELCIPPNNSHIVHGVWRYNLTEHVTAMHPGHTQRSQFSQKFLELLDISSAEQLAMGIPQEQIPPDNSPSTHNSPHATKRRAQDPLPSPRQTKMLRST